MTKNCASCAHMLPDTDYDEGNSARIKFAHCVKYGSYCSTSVTFHCGNGLVGWEPKDPTERVVKDSFLSRFLNRKLEQKIAEQHQEVLRLAELNVQAALRIAEYRESLAAIASGSFDTLPEVVMFAESQLVRQLPPEERS